MSDSPLAAGALTIGATVGNYKILEKIGEGGMGAVYLAAHPLLGRKAAVKVLLPEHSKKAGPGQPLLQRGQDRRQPAPPGAGRGVRLRVPARRVGLHRHGLPRGREPGQPPGAGGAAGARGGGGDRPADGRRRGGRPRAGDRPPRSQARQRVPGARPRADPIASG